MKSNPLNINTYRGLGNSNKNILRIKKFLLKLWRFPEVYTFIGKPKYNYRVNSIRLKIWTSLCRINKNFDYIYNSSIAKSAKKELYKFKLEDAKSKNINEMCINAKKFGFAYIEDFLPEWKLEKIKNEFLLLDKEDSSYLDYGNKVRCKLVSDDMLYKTKKLDDDYINYFKDDIAKIALRLLGKKIIVNEVTMQRLSGSDKKQLDPNLITHIDRFIPCIKVFYFPESIKFNNSPFGYNPYTHLITSDYLKAVKSSFKVYNANSKDPFTINNTLNSSEFAVTTKGNCLVVAITNGLHRRMPFTNIENGNRNTLRFHFYNGYNKLDIVTGCIFSSNQ